MRSLLIVPALAVLTACGVSQRQLDFQQHLQTWVGRSFSDYVQGHGKPQSMSTSPDGSQVAIYHRQRVDTTQVGTTQVVNVDSGERANIQPGQSSDPAMSEIGKPGRTRLVQDKTVMRVDYECTTTLRIDPSGHITKIEATGNDCD